MDSSGTLRTLGQSVGVARGQPLVALRDSK